MGQEPQSGPLDVVEHLLRKVAVVFTVWTYLLFAPPGLVVFAVLAVLWRGDPKRCALRLQTITVGAYRLMHDWLSLIRVARFNHREKLPGIPEGPCVIIANHPTLMDITSIHAVVGVGCTIVKRELFQRRLLRPMLRAAGNIEGPGSDLLSMRRVIDEAVERLEDGQRLVVFPEGTRSPKGKLGRFGRAPFEIARRAGVPLVSLTIECEPPYLTKEVPLYRPPSKTPILRLGLLSIDHPTSGADAEADSRDLRMKVEARYRAWLGGVESPPDVYDPPSKERPCQSISKTS